MDFIDFLGDSGAGDAASTMGGSSASDYFTNMLGNGGANGPALGSGMYGTDDQSMQDLYGLDTNTGMKALQQAQENGTGVTGIPVLDKVLANLGQRFEQDPLSMIGTGLGILGKIADYKRQKEMYATGKLPFIQPPRADDAFRGANTAANMPAARGPAPQPGALSRMAPPVQIPIIKG